MSVLKNVKLTSVDDLFSTEASRADEKREKVQEIPLSELYPFKNHPFKVLDDDDKMKETVESVQEHGVLVPAIARPRADGGFEIVSGHRRKRACEKVGLDTMPVIVRNLDDDAATVMMVDSNIQREALLPSERAFAYKMKLEALKHQGKRTDLTSCQLGTKLRADEKAAQDAGKSARTVQRYIRLTELIPPLLDKVDTGEIAFNPAVELSYLKEDEQVTLLDAMAASETTPSLSQAQRLKTASRSGLLTDDMIYAIMAEPKKREPINVQLPQNVLHKYFPSSWTPKQIQEKIVDLIQKWSMQKQHDQER